MYIGSAKRIYITNPFAKGWLILLFALVFGGVGVVMHMDTLAFLPGSISTTGTIVQCKTERAGNGHWTNEPVISFQTQSGRQVTFEPSESASCIEGDTMQVLYHPDDPQHARLDPTNAWLIFVVIGLAFVPWSLFYFVQGIMRKARGENVESLTKTSPF